MIPKIGKINPEMIATNTDDISHYELLLVLQEPAQKNSPAVIIAKRRVQLFEKILDLFKAKVKNGLYYLLFQPLKGHYASVQKKGIGNKSQADFLQSNLGRAKFSFVKNCRKNH